MRRLPILLTVLATLAVATSLAAAATPGSGSVSKAAPKFAWTGETDTGYLGYVPMFYAPEDAPCEAPRCDRFTLTVADAGGVLEVAVQNSGTSIVAMRITRPDGSATFEQGEASKPHKMKVTSAAAGDYLVDVTNNALDPVTYKATATLTFADAAAPAAETPAPAPGGGTQPQTQPQQQTQPTPPPATTATIKAPAASAKKLKKAKKLVVSATTSSPLDKVTVQVLKGTKTVASGRLARLEGAAKVTVKTARGLKAGRYVIALQGTDAAGRSVTAKTNLTVRR